MVFKVSHVKNVHMINLDDVSKSGTKCLFIQSEVSWLWHKRLGHVHFELINKIVSKELVISLPKLKFSKSNLCDACRMGMQIR